jgi:hypothetical protein
MSVVESTNDITQSFTGRLVSPSDEDYDQLRQVHNGLIDKRPALIARCRGVADVVDLLREFGYQDGVPETASSTPGGVSA